MEDILVRITPNKERAASVIAMAEKTLSMIKTIDTHEFPSNIIKEYYEVIREFISAILLLDGYRTIGDEAHKKQFAYFKVKYKDFNGEELFLIDELRVIRNRISYEGFFVQEDYLVRKLPSILNIVTTLQRLIKKKLNT